MSTVGVARLWRIVLLLLYQWQLGIHIEHIMPTRNSNTQKHVLSWTYFRDMTVTLTWLTKAWSGLLSSVFVPIAHIYKYCLVLPFNHSTFFDRRVDRLWGWVSKYNFSTVHLLLWGVTLHITCFTGTIRGQPCQHVNGQPIPIEQKLLRVRNQERRVAPSYCGMWKKYPNSQDSDFLFVKWLWHAST